MKTTVRFAVGLALLLALSAPQACAQLKSGSYYTRKVAPQPARPTPARPAAPVRPAAPAIAPAYQPAASGAAATAPVDPERAKAEKDALVKRTVEFQKKRAEAGSETAQYDLGIRYLNGDGVEQDLKLAKKWLKASAEKGHKFAAKKLAEIEAAELKAGGPSSESASPKSPNSPSDSKPEPKPSE